MAEKTLFDICDSWPFAKAQLPGVPSRQGLVSRSYVLVLGRGKEENETGAKCACEMGEGITEDKMETISIRVSVLSVWQLAGKGGRAGLKNTR